MYVNKVVTMKFFECLLAENYKSFDLEWYMVSEKLDGYRATFLNGVFRTRTGNEIKAPESFTKNLPRDIFLDGELFMDRGEFNETSSVLRKKVPIEREWKRIRYMVFDVPCIVEPFQDRYKYIKELLGAKSMGGNFLDTKYISIKVLKQFRVLKVNDLGRINEYVLKRGGEGLMLRDPNSYYENKRSSTLLKYKLFEDAEAIVEGFEFGNNRNSDKMGKLWVKWISDGVSFKVGGGFTDIHRVNYSELFPKGTIIKVKYFEKNRGIPRFPIFTGIVPVSLVH
ncbi:putative DNA ligase [Mimivirus AB-566-O17]|uniref:DNA ligase n=1 Tax=Mimivirus AB-566-O17 TaxID=1988039 RepID=A0A1X9VNY8_9VIRU|nr:putative DNA ligase [Mimivirus AB-566-O17]